MINRFFILHTTVPFLPLQTPPCGHSNLGADVASTDESSLARQFASTDGSSLAREFASSPARQLYEPSAAGGGGAGQSGAGQQSGQYGEPWRYHHRRRQQDGTGLPVAGDGKFSQRLAARSFR